MNRMFENPSFTLVHNPNYHHLINKGSLTHSCLVGSCNGLILLSGLSQQEEYWFRIWNPATGTASEKIGCFRHPDIFLFAIGCDDSTETYKVVAYCTEETTSEVRVLNLGDDVWRNIDTFHVLPYFGKLRSNAVNLSGTLNWLAIHNKTVVTIVSLDLGTETYKQYMVPCGVDEVLHNSPTIGVLGGCLCFSYSHKETDLVISQMKKFGVEDSWTQLLKISYNDLLIDYDHFSDFDRQYFQLVPLFLSDDGDSLILQNNLESQTILYNRRDNRAKRTNFFASTTTADGRTAGYAFWDFAKDMLKLESLVPIF